MPLWKAITSDIMGSMTGSILYIGEKESSKLNAKAAFPMLAVYAYHAYCHYEKNESMYIHRPEKIYLLLKISCAY